MSAWSVKGWCDCFVNHTAFHRMSEQNVNKCVRTWLEGEKREGPHQTVTKRPRTWNAVEFHAPSHYGPLSSFVKVYYVLSSIAALTRFLYDGLLRFSSAPWLPWQIFGHPKICFGIHGYQVLSRLPIPSHEVVSRPSRFVYGSLARWCRGRREHSVTLA